MDKFQIETSQNVGIQQNVAGIVDRMLAFMVDSLVIFFYFIFIFWILVALELEPSDSWTLYLLASLPAFLYYLLFETFTNGKTAGKYLVNIRVVKLDGSKPTFSSYFLRWILRFVEVTLTFCGGAVFTILLNGKGQRLGDIAAGTTVISERRKITLAETLHEEIDPTYQPTYPQVTVFSDGEMQEIKSIFENAKKHANHQVIIKLRYQIEKVMDVKTEETAMDFIQKVILDFNYYTQKL